MNRFCFVAVWIGILAFGINHYTYAQAEDTCRVTYDFLWEVPKQDSLILPLHAKLRLSRDIFTEKGTDANTSFSTTIYQYKYLRPATRQEIKSQKVVNSNSEIVKLDSNVYAPEALGENTIFLKKPNGFDSSLELQKIGDQFIIPEGLRPISITKVKPKTLELIKQEKGFWELKGENGTWVFYPQIADPYTVFDLPKNDSFVKEKGRKAQQLIGKTFISLEKEVKTEWTILNIATNNHTTTLTLTSTDKAQDKTTSLVLSRKIPFEIYDPACLEMAKKKEEERLMALAEAEKIAKEEARKDSIIRVKRDSLRQDSLTKVQIALEEEEKLQAAIQAEIEADRKQLIAEMSGASSPTSVVSRSFEMSPLRKKFELIKDPILDWNWYLHNNQSLDKIIKDSYLKLNLNEYGDMYLLSILTTDTTFRHVKIQVNIGEYNWESDLIYPYDDRNVVEKYDEYFQEKIHFTNKDTHEIIEKIVDNYDDFIYISFLNEEGEKIDYQLSIPHRIAFKDTYLLYQELNNQTNN